MVPFILIYLASIIVSIGINRSTYLSVLKKFVDDGKYVVSFDGIYKELFGVRIPELLIPFYNVLRSVYQGVNAVNNIDTLYKAFDKSNMLEIIEFEKQKEYLKYPSVTNAKKLVKQHEKEIEAYSMIVFNDKSLVAFDALDHTMNKIKRTVGPISDEDIYYKMDRLNHAIELYYAYIDVCYEHAFHEPMSEEEKKSIESSQFNFDLSNIDDQISVEEFKEMMETILSNEQNEYTDKNTNKMRRIRHK